MNFGVFLFSTNWQKTALLGGFHGRIRGTKPKPLKMYHEEGFISLYVSILRILKMP